MINKIRNWLRNFLWLSDTFIGVDAGERDASCIIVISRRHNAVRIIEAYFPSRRDLDIQVEQIRRIYGVDRNRVIRDYPNR